MSEAFDRALDMLDRVFPLSGCVPIGDLPEGHKWHLREIPNKNGALEWVPLPVSVAQLPAELEPVFQEVTAGKSIGELSALECAGIFISQSFDDEGYPIIEAVKSYETEPSI